MARSCRFVFGSRSGAAEWSFDGSRLVVSPESGSPVSFAVAELAGIAGDGYTVSLGVPCEAGAAIGAPPQRGELALSMLGAEGPTLLEELRRKWLVARAGVLRLGGSGEGKPFSGWVAGLGGGAAERFQALLFEDVLVVACEARDLDPLFLALLATVEFDEATYAIRVRQWPGQEVVFSRLAGQTDEFLKCLRANRALLADESAVALAAAAPALPAGPRGALAGMWMPGKLLEVEAMEATCPGFSKVFRGEWMTRLPRHEEGEFLLSWASSGSAWLACTRESTGESGESAESSESEETGRGGAMSDSGETPEAVNAGEAVKTAGVGTDERPLWLLCGKEGVWFLEALSIQDRATYCFAGNDEVPPLVSRLLCAPQFSKEALYSPLTELTGESAELVVPATSLGFLVELRRRFRGRAIHQTSEGWRKDIEKLGSGGTG